MAGSSHGHTPAAWTGVIIAFIGFVVAGGCLVGGVLIGFWAGLALTVVGALVGGLMRRAGLGQSPDQHPVHRVAVEAQQS